MILQRQPQTLTIRGNISIWNLYFFPFFSYKIVLRHENVGSAKMSPLRLSEFCNNNFHFSLSFAVFADHHEARKQKEKNDLNGKVYFFWSNFFADTIFFPMCPTVRYTIHADSRPSVIRLLTGETTSETSE